MDKKVVEILDNISNVLSVLNDRITTCEEFYPDNFYTEKIIKDIQMMIVDLENDIK